MEAKKSTLFISCEEAAHICDKSQYNESSWWERFRLNLRMIYCKITRSYVKKNSQLTRLMSDKEVDCMDLKSKEEMKTSFQKELEKN